MDIKLIKNSEDAVFSSISNELILQLTDDNYKFLDFTGKKMYILNLTTNEKYEISPEIKKYNIADIKYAHNMHDYLFFVSAEQLTDSKMDILLYRYSFVDNESRLVYRYQLDSIKHIEEISIHIFVLEYDFVIIEEIGREDNMPKAIILRDFSVDKDISVKGSLLSRCGLYNIIPLEGNNCMFKFGRNKCLKNNDSIQNHIYDGDDYECIVVVNTRQFVSEMMLNPSEITMEELDSADSERTFTYMKRSGNRVIYSKFNMSTMSEEVVLYDFDNKVKQIRINNDIKEASDLNYTYVINDNPYMIRKDNDATYLVNLNTQKEEYKLPSDMKIRYVINDVLLVTRKKQGLPFVKKGSEYIEAYRFPDIQHALLKKKAEFKACIINGEDLLVFTM